MCLHGGGIVVPAVIAHGGCLYVCLGLLLCCCCSMQKIITPRSLLSTSTYARYHPSMVMMMRRWDVEMLLAWSMQDSPLLMMRWDVALVLLRGCWFGVSQASMVRYFLARRREGEDFGGHSLPGDDFIFSRPHQNQKSTLVWTWSPLPVLAYCLDKSSFISLHFSSIKQLRKPPHR